MEKELEIINQLSEKNKKLQENWICNSHKIRLNDEVLDDHKYNLSELIKELETLK